jgi:hypothetical protein
MTKLTMAKLIMVNLFMTKIYYIILIMALKKFKLN